MRIAVGADHAGYQTKEMLAALLAEEGHAVTDFGTHNDDPVDYPDLAAAVASAVQDGRAERGIVICGSGAGACIAANKLKGIRAVQGTDTYTAHQAVEHDDANVLCLGSRILGWELIKEVVASFLGARFQPVDRYVRRLDKVKALEAGWS